MSIVFGLDFGTTHSAISVNRNGNVAIIDNFGIRGSTLRSIIYFNERGNIYLGEQAISSYLENDAVGRLIKSIKTYLRTPTFEYTLINNRRYRLEDFVAIILKYLKAMGEIFINQEVNDVIIGRPVLFSDDEGEDMLAEWRLKRAAEIAGFKNIKFQMEPIAAALTYEEKLKPEQERIVLVADFGGGTSDFSIIKLRGGSEKSIANRTSDVLSLSGVPIAGDVFDSIIMWEKVAKYFGKDSKFKSISGEWLDMPLSLVTKLKNWYSLAFLKRKEIRSQILELRHSADDRTAIDNLLTLVDDNYGFMLFQEIERAKIGLSSSDSDRIEFRKKGLGIDEEITREEFENIIREQIEKIENSIDEALNKANLLPAQIDNIFLTGGTSNVPCVREIFIRKFGEEKIMQSDIFTSVAFGLGLSASLT